MKQSSISKNGPTKQEYRDLEERLRKMEVNFYGFSTIVTIILGTAFLQALLEG